MSEELDELMAAYRAELKKRGMGSMMTDAHWELHYDMVTKPAMQRLVTAAMQEEE